MSASVVTTRPVTFTELSPEDEPGILWYEWWFSWALANCERPAIRMS